jgi:energy-coupling factor transporter ATP-binding protein EcfA2
VIKVNGATVSFNSPRDAIAKGIGMVHQHFMLVPTQSVTENILLGLKQPRFFMNLPRYERQILELQEQYGLRVDPKAKIWQLSVGEQQRVEILKTLYRGANVLILDEPTAVLAPQEIDELIATMRALVAQGKSIIFISHKLHEVTAVADRITVLRKGRVTAEGLPMAGRTRHELAQLMVGRDVVFQVEKEPHTPGDVVLRVDGVQSASTTRARPRCAAFRWMCAPARSSGSPGWRATAKASWPSASPGCATAPRPDSNRRGQRHQPAAAGGHPGWRGPHPRRPQPRRLFAQPDYHRQRDHEALSLRPHRQRHDHQRCDGAGICAHAEDKPTTSWRRVCRPWRANSPAAICKR